MGKTLVVVESPAKAKTIKKYLGAKYEVVASKGHIKDLPKKLGVDIERGFQETYEVVPGKEKVLQELKDAARDVDEVLLATDPDREGEAIAWHIYEELKPAKKSTKRVEFHEITKKGVEYGVSHPRALDKHLYDAQRARRVLDRIVGYDVSALVWSKLAFGLSAGRVQSVALRLIVDREREIEAFVPEEYWNCGASLAAPNGGTEHPFIARLVSRDGEKLAVKNGQTAAQVRTDLEGAQYSVAKVTKSERKRNPPRRIRRASSSRTPSIGSASAPSGRCKSRRGSTKASTSAKTPDRSASSRTCAPTRRACRPTRSTRRAISSRSGMAPSGSPPSRTSSSRRRTRRTRTKPFAPPRSSSRPRACAGTSRTTSSRSTR